MTQKNIYHEHAVIAAIYWRKLIEFTMRKNAQLLISQPPSVEKMDLFESLLVAELQKHYYKKYNSTPLLMIDYQVCENPILFEIGKKAELNTQLFGDFPTKVVMWIWEDEDRQYIDVKHHETKSSLLS